ncbi:MAG: SPOR domain-containing protein [Pseudomonadota bacterium]
MRLARPILCLGLAAFLVVEAADFNAAREAVARGDYAAAIEIWSPLAEEGDARAQFALGTLYDKGLGVQQDDVTAARWYRKAADRGLAPAQFNLGNAFLNGRGVPQDLEVATRYYRLAAEQGLPQAQFNLGTQLYLGRGAEQDLDAALDWYARAARNGHTQAQEMFASGQFPVPAGGAVATQTPPAAAAPAAEEPAGATTPTGLEALPVADGPAPTQPLPVPQPVRAPEPTARPAQVPPPPLCFADIPEDHYVIQLIALADAAGLAPYAARHGIRGPLHRCVIQAGERRLTALYVGAYGDRSVAQAAFAALPESLAGSGAWIRSVAAVRAIAVP